MERVIRDEIVRFVRESLENRFPNSDEPYFGEPLIGFAAADDPLFNDFKKIIGEFHLTPAEIMETGCGLCQTKVPCESRVPFHKKYLSPMMSIL